MYAADQQKQRSFNPAKGFGLTHLMASIAGLLLALTMAGCGGGGGNDDGNGGGGGGSGGGGSSGGTAVPPTAAAGIDQTVKERDTVSLDAAASTAGSPGTLSYTWSVADAGGLALQLQNADARVANFVAPTVTADTTVTLRLTVNNGSAAATDELKVLIRPVTDSISLAVLGLGNEILVTNQPTVTLAGVAAADAPLLEVAFTNQANATSGKASGTAEWSAPVALVAGDNALKFTAKAQDGRTVDVTKIITYYPNLALSTPLTLSTDIAYTATSTDVVVTLGVAKAATATVTLVQTDTAGTVLSDVGKMLDNGSLPDEIQGDGIVTGKASFNTASSGQKCFRARIAPAGEAAYYSEVRCVWVTAHYSAAELKQAIDLADGAQAQYLAAVKTGQLPRAAAAAVLVTLKAKPQVGAAGEAPDGGLWWVSSAGILGAYHPILAVTSKKATAATRSSAATAALANPVAPPSTLAPTVMYPQAYLQDRSAYRPQAANGAVSSQKQALAVGTDNLVGSSKAVIISPYINNPADTGNSFGQADDYYVPWKTVQQGNQCMMYSQKEALNNGSNAVTLEDFKDLSSYGYIHISTHGDNFYNGLLSLWQDSWGPNGWLTGSLSQVLLYSGVVLAKDSSGNYLLGTTEADVQAKRIAIGPDGTLALLPGFFQRYLKALPNSLVALSACRSTYNNSLVNVFLSKGAGAVVGYDNYVATTYAQNTLKTILTDMYASKTIKQAFDNAVATHGSNDKGEPAYINLAGSNTLKFGTGQFGNLGFEAGNLTPWQTDGDGRVISQLGATLPTTGAHMGIISTGLGYTTASGSVQQTACLAPKAKSLKFRWNFFSEEFKEYCGSVYQDAFKVELCEVKSGVAGSCTPVFTRTIDQLCAAVTKSDVSFDQGGVYHSGWGTADVDISTLAGKNVMLKFSATDVGDSVYDSAILLDDIQIVESP